MRIEEMVECPLIDGHIHYPHMGMMESLIDTADRLKLGRFNIVCTPEKARLSLVPDALHLKANHPDRVYVFGGLNISAYFNANDRVGEQFMGDIDLLRAAGCDGIKIIEGKPMMRKMLPVPSFDSPSFAPFWEKAAETGIPIVMHVNDPEEFWDRDRVPDWAAEQGWFYGDGTYINNEAQYSEVLNVLKRNPALNIIFAHFFFMSAQLERLADLLEEFPGMKVDLTPGIEMYHNFSKDIDRVRDFFLKYQDRIIFGTDIGAKALLADPGAGIDFADSHGRVTIVRSFLETEGEFFMDPAGGFLFGDPSVPFLGIALPPDVLDKIYFRNFERAAGAQPTPVNPGVVIEMCGHIEGAIQAMGSIQPGVPGDASVAQAVRAFFSQ